MTLHDRSSRSPSPSTAFSLDDERQLMANIENIHASLMQLKSSTISFDKSSSASKAEILEYQWQCRILLNQALLNLANTDRPDSLLDLFYWTAALVSVYPLANAREPLSGLLESYQGWFPQHGSMVFALLATHGVLLSHGSTEHFLALENQFLSLMRRESGFSGEGELHLVYIMSSNFASFLEYGAIDSVVAAEFRQYYGRNTASAHADAIEWAASKAIDRTRPNDSSVNTPLPILPWTALHGGSLAFHTLQLLLDRMEDRVVRPGVHVSLAFIWCLALHPLAIQHVEQAIPWSAIAMYLNSLWSSDIMITKIEEESFPLIDGITAQQLPEDFLIQGQIWSQLYYPEYFFRRAKFGSERTDVEESSTAKIRDHRCLWLGVRISTVSDHFQPI
ncbi:DNA/RNA-binding domain E.t1.c1-type [Penicillium sp. IBT 18751x]|nr:DNA/RNA-binding domain E.t1.c1-type [Penicillium sp. IBT 18751x]